MMTQAREGGLSTADMVSAGERRDVDRDRPDAEGFERGPERNEPMDRPVDTMDRPADTMEPRPQQVEPPAEARPMGAPGGAAKTDGKAVALLPSNETTDLRSRWDAVQIGFVDEPRQAVEQADSLVAEVMKRIAEGFAAERSELEHQWDRGDEVSTEDLRVALQRYRSFFDRLLSL